MASDPHQYARLTLKDSSVVTGSHNQKRALKVAKRLAVQDKRQKPPLSAWDLLLVLGVMAKQQPGGFYTTDGNACCMTSAGMRVYLSLGRTPELDVEDFEVLWCVGAVIAAVGTDSQTGGIRPCNLWPSTQKKHCIRCRMQSKAWHNKEQACILKADTASIHHARYGTVFLYAHNEARTSLSTYSCTS